MCQDIQNTMSSITDPWFLSPDILTLSSSLYTFHYLPNCTHIDIDIDMDIYNYP